MENKMKRELAAAGLDWGNGYIKGAILGANGIPESVRNDQTGLEWTPSAFLIQNNGVLWGEAAYNARALDPRSFVAGEDIKGNLGNDSWKFTGSDGKPWTAAELFSLGVTRYASLIERQTGGRLFRVQPTFPENFTQVQRQAVVDAYRAAGVDALPPISEPVAAAYWFAAGEPFSTAVILDIGHGTTDISVVRLEGKKLRVLAHSGIPMLGGRDFRRALEEAYMADLGASVVEPSDPESLAFAQELRLSAERAKITLSSVSEATVVATPPGGKPHGLTISRKRFEEATAPLADQIAQIAQRVLSEANVSPQGAKWFLVGGGSRVPVISRTLHEKLGIAATAHPQANNATALGAALLAGERITEEGEAPIDDKGRPTVGPGIELFTAAPYTLGVLSVSSKGGPQRLTPLIRRNSPIPAQAHEYFYPLFELQKGAMIVVAQGDEGATRENSKIIGELYLHLDPPATRDTRIKVTIGYDQSGMLSVEAIDMRNSSTVRTEMRAIEAAPSAA